MHLVLECKGPLGQVIRMQKHPFGQVINMQKQAVQSCIAADARRVVELMSCLVDDLEGW